MEFYFLVLVINILHIVDQSIKGFARCFFVLCTGLSLGHGLKRHYDK